MASAQKASKPGSRWNFIQQAVASVESKLDTILADDEDGPKKSTAQAQSSKDNVPPKRISADLSRSNSGAQANDRLQERLARAMAKKSASRPESPMPPSEPSSRTATPLPPKLEEDATPGDDMAALNSSAQKSNIDQQPSDTDLVSLAVKIIMPHPVADEAPNDGNALDSEAVNAASIVDLPSTAVTPSARTSIDSSRNIQPVINGVLMTAGPQTIEPQPQPQHETSTVVDPLQAELNGYIERIDALQAKLFYLTSEATTSVRKAIESTEIGTAERKILEKEEKIALLLEEGQRLSKAEMKHLTTVKKLRSQVIATNREQADTKIRAEKAENRASSMEDRAKRAEAITKRTEENLAASLNKSRDFDAIAKERNALAATVADMKAQLARANTRAEQAERKAQLDQFEKEKRRAEELQGNLTSLKLERDLSVEKLKREIGDLKASLEREKEHSRVTETEMLGEQAILESRLESFRARAEEATSNDHGDAQAKLLRQIEMLQSQHASASQNWQGIEGTLLSRISNIEKERDDLTTREADVRKKLRDATLKARQTERQLEEMNEKIQDLDRSQADAQGEVQRAVRKTQQLEEELSRARKELEEQSAQGEKKTNRRIEEEKTKWLAVNAIQRQDPSGLPVRKSSAYDIGHHMSPVQFDRAHSRRSSIMQAGESNTPPCQYCTTSFRNQANGNGTIPETPSIMTSMDDEYFGNIPPTPASQNHTTSNRGVQDIISTSTVAAGPSLQLVERMSANVRRLESEKAASKDELARLTGQRDEARQEVVGLMREVEQKRALDRRLQKIEEEHKGLSQRYEATLEMLGEKTEMVEELKADVTDVKQMYRELVDTMGK